MPETPNGIVEAWLAQFDEALRSKNIDAALELFEDESYWRDFVSFTWNLKTLEGRPAIKRMLEATLDHVRPGGWALAEDATGDAATTEAWVDFETAQARGYAHLRLRDGKCWTLLTTMKELKGFEEKKGPNREKGVAHEISKGRKSWLELKEEHEARLGYEDQPTRSSSAAARAESGWARDCAGSASPPSSSRRTNVPETRGGTATNPSTSTTPSGTTTSRT
ncbi:involved in K+ transport protein [Arthrobacter sp. Hiyo6]|nr:involved in K+ transport protein [Arthrobacter sp. Hiyo6]